MNNDYFLKFKELLSFVFENKYSDFYRVKYEKAEFNPSSDFNSMDDVKKIPFLTKDELSNTEPPKLLFVDEKELDFISPTSGTTGEPSITFNSVPDASIKTELYFLDQEKLKVLILCPPIRVPPLYSYLKSFFLKAIKQGGWVLVGDIYNLPVSCQLASKLGINTIYTAPSMAVILKDYLKSYPNLEKLLKFFILCGEAVSPTKKKLLKKLYPNLEIFTQYGLAEAGLAAFQCPHLAQKEDQFFHLMTSGYFYEIINPRTGKEVEAEEKGEMVLTTFSVNLATPLIRYKTGDLVSFKENKCPCRSPGPLLQIWGRVDYDMVRAGGFELRKEMIEKPILNLRDCLKEDFEAHIYENFVGNKPKIKIELNLSLKEGVEESPELRQRIENEFLENWQLSPRLNLKEAVEAGLFEPLQINFVKFSKSSKPRGALILH